MDTAKFFDIKSSKKRVLCSEQSETGDESKKQKEGSRNKSSTSTLDDVFAEGLYNPECVLILANCLHSLKQQVNETFDLAKKLSQSQIKGKLALQMLAKQYHLSVKSLTHMKKKGKMKKKMKN